MSRNGAGTYSLPAGNPVVGGTVITTTWANTTLSDIATALTDSLSRSGLGRMSTALGLVDGTALFPAINFTSALTTGLYAPSADALGFTTNGVARGSISNAGNWTVIAPTSGVTLALGQNASQVAMTFTDGVVTGRAFIDSGIAFIGTATSHGLRLQSNGISRIELSAAGNVTINAPASGDTFVINGVTALHTLTQISTGAASSFRTGWNVGLAGGQWNLYTAGTDSLSLGAAGTGSVNVFSGGAAALQITAGRNAQFNAPTSGSTLIVSGLNGQQIIQATNGTVQTGFYIDGTPLAAVGTFTSHPFDLRTNSLTRVQIASTGTVSILPPSTGTALEVTGLAGQATASFVTASNDCIVALTSTGGSGRTHALRSNNDGTFTIRDNTAGLVRYTLSATGNHTLAQPTSGTALTISSVTGGSGITVTDGTVTGTSAGFGGTTFNFGSTSTHDVRLFTNNSPRLTISANGNFTIAAPAAGTAALILPLSTTSVAPLRIPHGSAPTSPGDGDIWTTTAGLFVRINGVTVGPLT